MQPQDWLPGPPSADGRYVVETEHECRYCVTVTAGRITCDGCSRSGRPALEAIILHFPLADTPKPLQLPRRFRAKYQGRDVVGVQVGVNHNNLYWEDGRTCGWNRGKPVTDIQWIDD